MRLTLLPDGVPRLAAVDSVGSYFILCSRRRALFFRILFFYVLVFRRPPIRKEVETRTNRKGEISARSHPEIFIGGLDWAKFSGLTLKQAVRSRQQFRQGGGASDAGRFALGCKRSPIGSARKVQGENDQTVREPVDHAVTPLACFLACLLAHSLTHSSRWWTPR